jgi:hypothetical protein
MAKPFNIRRATLLLIGSLALLVPMLVLGEMGQAFGLKLLPDLPGGHAFMAGLFLFMNLSLLRRQHLQEFIAFHFAKVGHEASGAASWHHHPLTNHAILAFAVCLFVLQLSSLFFPIAQKMAAIGFAIVALSLFWTCWRMLRRVTGADASLG